MREQDNIERVRRANDRLLNHGDLESAAEFFASEYVAHLTDEDLRGDGPDVIRGFVRQFRAAFPDLRADVEVLVANEDRVAWWRTCSATHQGEFMGIAASGHRITWRDMVVTRFVNGKIAEEWAVSDLGAKLGTVSASQAL